MTLGRLYIGYLGFLGIDLFKSVLMYSNGAICLIKLLFKMGLFTVHTYWRHFGKNAIYSNSLFKDHLIDTTFNTCEFSLNSTLKT